MSINAAQFQARLSMPEFFASYSTEANWRCSGWHAPSSAHDFFLGFVSRSKCYRALYKWRWLQGFRCPCCAGRVRSRFKRGGIIYYQCSACRHQTSLIAGTMFQGTKLPLRTWCWPCSC